MSALKTPIAMLAAAVLAACNGTTGETGILTPGESPSPTATVTVSPSPTETSSPSGSPSPRQGGPLGDAEDCENEELGYEVDYPGDWWANDRIEPEDENLTPIEACQYFAANEVELQPNAGLPNGIAIQFQESDSVPQVSGERLVEESTTVDDQEAVRFEDRPEPSDPFVPEGSMVYGYAIEVGDGRYLVATTDNILQDDARYEESKAILDAMIETLEVDDDREDDD